VGDPVMVQTPKNNMVEAEVVKRGRKYLTVQWAGSTRTDEFDMATGQFRYDGNLHIFSMEQHALNLRRKAVADGLRELGVELRRDHGLTLEVLEKFLELIHKEQP
jgi:hypothetical protein